MKKHWTVYKFYDKSMKYREDKADRVRFYNAKHGTNYRYISEFVQNLYLSETHVLDICDYLDITENAVYAILDRMNIRKLGGGGKIPRCSFTALELEDIRTSKKMQKELAEEYGVSAPTIGSIKKRTGRWVGL